MTRSTRGLSATAELLVANGYRCRRHNKLFAIITAQSVLFCLRSDASNDSIYPDFFASVGYALPFFPIQKAGSSLTLVQKRR